MKGFVKWYNRKKGYGFVKGDDDNEYFVHYTALDEGTFIRDNDQVSFDGVQTDKGNQAQNVKLVKKASEMSEDEKPSTETTEEAPVQESATEAPVADVKDSEDFGDDTQAA